MNILDLIIFFIQKSNISLISLAILLILAVLCLSVSFNSSFYIWLGLKTNLLPRFTYTLENK